MTRSVILVPALWLFIFATAALTLRAHAQSLPQGLTCGLSYWDDDGIFDDNTCNGVHTVGLDLLYYTCIDSYTDYCQGCNCLGACLPSVFGRSECLAWGWFWGPHAA